MTPRPQETPSAGRFSPALRLAREGRFEEAIEAVRAASGDGAAADAAANALARIARAAEAAERLEPAERALSAALALRSGYPDLHHQHACVLLQRGRRAEARQALERALAIHPGYVAARVERALLDAREGRIGEALQELRGLAAECRIEEAPAFERGLERLREADVAAAGTWFQQAFRAGDPELDGRLEQARGWIEGGEPARAIPLLRGMLPRCAHYADVHALLGIAELRLGQADDALDSLARALELKPDFHEARVALACALYASGASAHALEQLRLVTSAEPGHADAERLLARWTRRAGGREIAAG